MSRYEKVIGHCAVDSGQIMLVDPCYIESDFSGDMVSEVVSSGKGHYTFADGTAIPRTGLPMSYDGACQASLGEDQGGQLGKHTAVVGSSGYGDGVYPVTATYETDTGGWGTRIVSLRIDFIEDEIEEDEEDWEEEEDDS